MAFLELPTMIGTMAKPSDVPVSSPVFFARERKSCVFSRKRRTRSGSASMICNARSDAAARGGEIPTL